MTKIRLSPSKLKTFDNCSYLYHLRYGAGADFPNPSNDGSNRGLTVHYTLECLGKEKRRDYVDAIIRVSDPFSIPSVKRLILIHAKKLKVDSEDNLKQIKEFILVALNNDFFCDGALELLLEQRFFIEGKNYLLNGVIDQLAIYEDKIFIRDFKTSKQKFSQDELQFNYQNLIYTLAIKKKYPNLPVSLTFQFLKFKRAPNQPAPILTDEQLSSFELYLEYMADYLSDWTEEKALSNLAKNNVKNRWLCGKEILQLNAAGDKAAYVCSSKYPRNYWVLYDDKGKMITSDFTKKTLDEKMKEGYSIEMKSFGGCPAWKHLWKD